MRDHQDIADEQGWNRAIEACLDIVDAEEELEGHPTEDVLAAIAADPELALRAAVRVTKRNIRAQIEALRK